MGGKISSIKYNEMPKDEDIPVNENWENKIMHSALTFEDGNTIYFSDAWENDPVRNGSNSAIHLVVESEQEVYDIVDRLSVDGEVTMAADRTFWNSVYGSLIDRYGIIWGIEFELLLM